MQRIFHTDQLLKHKALDSCYLLLQAGFTFTNRDWLKKKILECIFTKKNY